jgi:hypothetical protein
VTLAKERPGFQFAGFAELATGRTAIRHLPDRGYSRNATSEENSTA